MVECADKIARTEPQEGYLLSGKILGQVGNTGNLCHENSGPILIMPRPETGKSVNV